MAVAPWFYLLRIGPLDRNAATQHAKARAFDAAATRPATLESHVLEPERADHLLERFER
jgi:hypothetical protein